MGNFNHSQDIVVLIKKLKGQGDEYPSGLFATRRVSFIELISRYIVALVRI